MVQGCAGPARLSSRQHESSVVSPHGKLDFGWKLSGARSIAPLQVFSDSKQTWLQWSAQKDLPAILASDQGAEHVLSYTRQDPYTIIAGHWPRLIFRQGNLQAQARHVESTQLSSQMVSSQSGALNQSGAPNQSGVQNQLGTQKKESSTFTDHSVSTRNPSATQSHMLSNAQRSNSDMASAEQPHTLVTHAPVYEVTPQDQNLRQTLTRWSGISGWYFQPEHWGVDVDIPLAGGAKFSDDFVSSVQALVGSTELSDRPLQPCFYANQVLRVIAISEPCDRTTTPIVAGAPA